MDVATWYPVIAMLCTGFVLGGMAFFSFVLAPLVFRQLEREEAAAFMRAAFPLYYQSMAAGAIVAAFAMVAVGRADSLLMAVVAVGFILLLTLLLPALNRHREGRVAGDADADARFKRLHGFSMVVNLVQLAAVVAAMVRLGL